MNPVRQHLLDSRMIKVAADTPAQPTTDLLNSKVSINDILTRLGGAFSSAGQFIQPAYDYAKTTVAPAYNFALQNKAGIGAGLGLAAGAYGLHRLFRNNPLNLDDMDDATAMAHLSSRLPIGSSIYTDSDIARIKRNAYIKAGLGGLAIGGSLGTIGGYRAGKRRASADIDDSLNSLRSAYSNPYDMYSQQRLSPYGEY